MHFKRLEIQGFKTFAQRTVFEFRPGITAIVGPNGSGKSNLADAVRWVLGEQSYAALRCKRTEELLFSGGGRRPPAGLAEVSLTIDNSDRLLLLDFDEVTITRRATRAGDNEYFINRAKVRLRDIQEATAPLGGSYTIINQGLVDAALTLRPEERRRLFEDAAEIGSFEVRKAEAERRLRETDANMQRIADLLSELEPRLRSLKRQAGQARQHRELTTELRELLHSHYRAQGRTAQSALRAAEAATTRLSAGLERARATQSAISAEVQQLRDTLRNRRERLGELHQQSSALHKRAEAAQRDLAVSDERLAALNRRAEDLERNHNDLELRAVEAERDYSAAATELLAAEANVAEQRERLGSCEAEIAAIETARRALAREMSAAQDAALKTATAVAEQRSRAEQLVNQRTRLLREQAELDTQLGQANERLAAAQAQVETTRAALAQADAAHSAADEAVAGARANLETLRSERSAAEEALASARRTHADAEARLESLTRLARSYAGTFAGVKTAMQWAERAGRQGFALVSTIVRTPAELETALEVALGSRLQNIVVETWQDAEDAIAELKRSGAGRATFLPLDTIRKTENREPLTFERASGAVLGVAAQLVEYDERYQAVVWQLLGRTLVVRDLHTARQELRRLSGGWTIVTLSGEQVSSGGAVTGGAATKESGTLRRERELRELPRQVEMAQQVVAQAEQQRRSLEERITAASQALREAEQRLREAQRQRDSQRSALDGASRRRSQAEQEYTWQQQRREAAARDLLALEEQQQSLTTRQTEAEANAATAQAHLAELRARQEAESAADRAQQERFATLRAAVASAESQVKAQRALVNNYLQARDRIIRQQAEASRAADQLAAERAQISAAHDRAEAIHAALLQEIDTLRTQIDPAEQELHSEETRLAEQERAEAQATAALLEQEASYNRAMLEAQRARDRVESLFERAAVDGIEIEDWDAESETDSTAVPPVPADELLTKIQALKTRIERLGVVNPLALEEYEQTAERHSFLSGQLDDLQRARTTLQELIGELSTAMDARFSETFHAVAAEFEQRFTRLFGGGAARLLLTGNGTKPNGNGTHEPAEVEEDNSNGRSYGVEIIARPPGKRQQNISLLSGGERTLTAAALLFAILTVNPSPFCILDEVDAALDESNVGRFREALAELTHTTQFILITHNRGTIEAADTIYGVTMGDEGSSRVLSLRIEEIAGLTRGA